MSMHFGSLQDFREFLRSKPPFEKYNYFSLKDCAIAQYWRARGREGYETRSGDWTPTTHLESLAFDVTVERECDNNLDYENIYAYSTFGELLVAVEEKIEAEKALAR